MDISLVIFVVFLNLIIFTFIGSMVKLGLDYRKTKMLANSGGSSLGTTELRDLIRDAVEEANAPLLERLETLEGQLDALPPVERPLLSAENAE